jgi:hypothetical protein
MKNKVSYLVTPNFFSIICNGETVKTVFNVEKFGTAFNYQRAHAQADELKWGIHQNKEIQKKFDSLLNK